jgi:sugar/nucleoside kinase (ribokinase family)
LVEPETKPLDVLTIGEMVVDFISAEKSDTLGNASTSRRYLGGSPANIAVYVSKLGGESAVIAKTGMGAFDGSVEHVGPLPKVQVENVTGARDALWSALLMAHLDGKKWPEAVHFAHEVASLKLRVEGHVERMIDRERIYRSLESAGQRTT